MTTILPEAVSSEGVADLLVRVSTFAGWQPEQTPSRAVAFHIPEYRVVRGIPLGPPEAVGRFGFNGQVGAYSADVGYLAPMDVNTQAAYRFMPDNYSALGWQHTPQTAAIQGRLLVPRTWDILKSTETWDSAARNETWESLKNYSVDTTSPVWMPFGDNDPVALPDYVYWRSGKYVPNPAVGLEGSQALSLVWDPTVVVNQFTVMMVVVPRAPIGDSYTLISCSNPEIHLVFNANSTISLLMEGVEATTLALGGRARPNEPIVVALGIVMDGSRTVMMSVVDEQVRARRATWYGNDVEFNDGSWTLNTHESSRMEILEVDLYTTVATEDSMLRVAQMFNRIYGVTAR